jgi:rhodanese-related sulfurtransferase
MTFLGIRLVIPAAASLSLAACSMPSPYVVQPPNRQTESVKPVPPKPRADLSSISLEDFFALQQSGEALIIDARPSFVYQFGHIPGALNIPKKRCAEEMPERESEFRKAIESGRKIVVYCTGLHCPDAEAVGHHLTSSGIPASVFHGGWDAWKEAGMPVE